MTKTKIRSALLALVLACCVAPAAAAWNAGAFDTPARAPVASLEAPPAEAPSVAAETVPVVEMPEVVIVGKARGKAAPVAKKAQAKPACRLQALEQGGSPGAPFVLVCG